MNYLWTDPEPLAGNEGGDPRNHARAGFPSGWQTPAQSLGIVEPHETKWSPPIFPEELTPIEVTHLLGLDTQRAAMQRAAM